MSSYQIDDDIDGVLKEVTKGGRPVTSRQERYGNLESFLAGPMPGDSRFGVTRYYRHQQYPDIWTVAIGQLNEFWVDDDDLVVVDGAAINAALNPRCRTHNRDPRHTAGQVTTLRCLVEKPG